MWTAATTNRYIVNPLLFSTSCGGNYENVKSFNHCITDLVPRSVQWCTTGSQHRRDRNDAVFRLLPRNVHELLHKITESKIGDCEYRNPLALIEALCACTRMTTSAAYEAEATLPEGYTLRLNIGDMQLKLKDWQNGPQ